jgi:hypothetical protein
LTRRLLILSESISKQRHPEEPIPAFERYTGVFFKVVKKLMREKHVKNLDIIIISQKYGVLKSTTKIPYYEPETPLEAGFGQKLSLTNNDLEEERLKNLETLKHFIPDARYTEVIVCLGKSYLQLIQGFEEQTKTPIKHVEGKGLGPKARNLTHLLYTESK